MKFLYLPFALSVFSTSIIAQCPPGDTVAIGIAIDSTIIELPMPSDASKFFKTAAGEKRIIYFLHGLGGVPDSWEPVSGATESQQTGAISGYPARKALTLNPTYTEVSMNSAIGNLHSNLQGMNDSNALSYDTITDNFIIAHSQGGIVSRGLDRGEEIDPFWERQFGGLVTFGSPHQGAAILDNALSIANGGTGKLEAFASEACTNLAKGPALQFPDTDDPFLSILISLLKLDVTLLNLTSSGCDFLGGSVLPIALSDYQQNIVNDYRPGASFITSLNQYQSTIPMVAFYGVEEKPEFWREMNSLLESPSNQNPFEANNDSTELDYTELRAHYVNQQYKFINEAHRLSMSYGVPCTKWHNWITNVANCLVFDNLYWRKHNLAKAYTDGVQWIDQANEKWKVIIGARETLTNQNGFVCECQNIIPGGPLSTTVVPNASDCEEGMSSPAPGVKNLCVVYPNWETTVTNKENDGIVLAESAKNLPGAIVKPGQDYSLDKSNHQQMRNNDQLKIKLNGLFEGDFGEYFFTDER